MVRAFSYAYQMQVKDIIFKDYIEINDNQENVLKVIKQLSYLIRK